MYRYLKLDPTFKQTKSVLGMLRKLPGPETIQNDTLYFSRLMLNISILNINVYLIHLIHELKFK